MHTYTVYMRMCKRRFLWTRVEILVAVYFILMNIMTDLDHIMNPLDVGGVPTGISFFSFVVGAICSHATATIDWLAEFCFIYIDLDLNLDM